MSKYPAGLWQTRLIVLSAAASGRYRVKCQTRLTTLDNGMERALSRLSDVNARKVQ